MSILRRDPVTGRWTILSPDRSLMTVPSAGRSLRPIVDSSDTSTPALRGPIHEGRGKSDFGSHRFCPFCPGHEESTPPAILTKFGANPKAWSVRVVPNRFPVLDPNARPDPSTIGIYDKLGGFGIHEVIIESPDHSADFAAYSPEQAARVVSAWHDRLVNLAKDTRIRSIMLFRNQGQEAGASLEHPHSQVIALPIVPKLLMQEISCALQYSQWKERCVFCDMIHEEAMQGVRTVADTRHFLAFTPYASRFPYEMWILPKKHQAHFHSSAPDQLDDLAGILRDLLVRLNLVLDRPAYNVLLHTSPCQEGELTHYHWHIEIMPRITKVAGFEWGTGFYLNPVMPESAAAELNAADDPGKRG